MQTVSATIETQATVAFQQHWPEYLIEAAELGSFMMSACVFTTLFEHPVSPVHGLLPGTMVRRVFVGMAMGLTAISIFFSPWGKRSGAHLNPGVTLAFYSLGKIRGCDAFFYVLAQFAGGIAGVSLARLLIGYALGHPSVNYAVTMPGPMGPWVAFGAEFLISFLMMSTVLRFSNSKRLTRWTPLAAGILVATFISIEAPLSGMSMDPARTLGSAVRANQFPGLWVYFAAPVLGMLLAARLYALRHGALLPALSTLALRAAPAVDSVAITVSDLDRSVDFYSKVLKFQKISEYEVTGEGYEHLEGVFGVPIRVARMQLGTESIELAHLAPKGAPVPQDSRANDRRFQHIAMPRDGRPYPPEEKANDLVHWQIRFSGIDAAQAVRTLRKSGAPFISSGVVELPDAKAGFRKSLIVRDPDGHAVEIAEQ